MPTRTKKNYEGRHRSKSVQRHYALSFFPAVTSPVPATGTAEPQSLQSAPKSGAEAKERSRSAPARPSSAPALLSNPAVPNTHGPAKTSAPQTVGAPTGDVATEAEKTSRLPPIPVRKLSTKNAKNIPRQTIRDLNPWPLSTKPKLSIPETEEKGTLSIPKPKAQEQRKLSVSPEASERRESSTSPPVKKRNVSLPRPTVTPPAPVYAAPNKETAAAQRPQAAPKAGGEAKERSNDAPAVLSSPPLINVVPPAVTAPSSGSPNIVGPSKISAPQTVKASRAQEPEKTSVAATAVPPIPARKLSTKPENTQVMPPPAILDVTATPGLSPPKPKLSIPKAQEQGMSTTPQAQEQRKSRVIPEAKERRKTSTSPPVRKENVSLPSPAVTLPVPIQAAPIKETAAPQTPQAVPIKETAAPQSPQAAPNKQIAAPQSPQAALNKDTAAPQSPQAAPIKETAAPQTPQAAQNKETAAPQSPQAAPKAGVGAKGRRNEGPAVLPSPPLTSVVPVATTAPSGSPNTLGPSKIPAPQTVGAPRAPEPEKTSVAATAVPPIPARKLSTKPENTQVMPPPAITDVTATPGLGQPRPKSTTPKAQEQGKSSASPEAKDRLKSSASPPVKNENVILPSPAVTLPVPIQAAPNKETAAPQSPQAAPNKETAAPQSPQVAPNKETAAPQSPQAAPKAGVETKGRRNDAPAVLPSPALTNVVPAPTTAPATEPEKTSIAATGLPPIPVRKLSTKNENTKAMPPPAITNVTATGQPKPKLSIPKAQEQGISTTPQAQEQRKSNVMPEAKDSQKSSTSPPVKKENVILPSPAVTLPVPIQAVPNKETAAPQSPQAAPNKVTAAPQSPQAAPNKEAAAPQSPQAAPNKETAVPQSPQAAPNKVTTVPQSPQAAPKAGVEAKGRSIAAPAVLPSPPLTNVVPVAATAPSGSPNTLGPAKTSAPQTVEAPKEDIATTAEKTTGATTGLPPIPARKLSIKNTNAKVKPRPTIMDLTRPASPKPKLSIPQAQEPRKLSISPEAKERKKSGTSPPVKKESVKVSPPLQVIKAPAGPTGRASIGKPENAEKAPVQATTIAPKTIPPDPIAKPQQGRALQKEKGIVKFDAPVKIREVPAREEPLITDKELLSLPVTHKSGLSIAQKVLIKPRPTKPHSIKKLGEKNEGELAQGVLKVFAQKVLEKGDLSRLQDFGIPEQRKLLNLMLHSDFGPNDFGGYMRECYSPVLRGYCALNMQERYRGGEKGAPCFTALDLTKIGTVEQVKERDRVKKLADRDIHLDELKKVSVDERHFRFLRELANNQPVSIPLTIIHELAVEILPMIKEMWEFYSKNLGPNHECTVQAGRSFIRLLNRVIMYNAL